MQASSTRQVRSGVIKSAERGCGLDRASYREARGLACAAHTLRTEERALEASGCTARCGSGRSTACTAAGWLREKGSQLGAAALRLGFCQVHRALDWRDAQPAHRVACRQAGVPRAGLGWRCARRTRCRRWAARHAPLPRRRQAAIPVRYATPRFDCIKPGALGSMRILRAGCQILRRVHSSSTRSAPTWSPLDAGRHLVTALRTHSEALPAEFAAAAVALDLCRAGLLARSPQESS